MRLRGLFGIRLLSWYYFFSYSYIIVQLSCQLCKGRRRLCADDLLSRYRLCRLVQPQRGEVPVAHAVLCIVHWLQSWLQAL